MPSTPSISQRELRIETIAASNTPTPIRKQSKRRSNIFTVRSPGPEELWERCGAGRGAGSPRPCQAAGNLAVLAREGQGEGRCFCMRRGHNR